jgi:preprotein translocase subunit YajC
VGSLILIVVMLAVLWLVFIVPQRRRQSTHRALLDNLKVGDEVLTAGGLYGFVREIREDDELAVEIAPGTEVRLARRSVAAVIPEEDDEEEYEDEEYEDDELEEAEAEAEPETQAEAGQETDAPTAADRRYPESPA